MTTQQIEATKAWLTQWHTIEYLDSLDAAQLRDCAQMMTEALDNLAWLSRPTKLVEHEQNYCRLQQAISVPRNWYTVKNYFKKLYLFTLQAFKLQL